MKSRYKKHIEKLVKNSPIIGFSIEDVFMKEQLITAKDFEQLNKHSGLEKITYMNGKFRNYKKDMYSDLLIFVDNYFVCGGHKFVYLIIPVQDNQFKIIEKESLSEWASKYWNKVDPNDERSWCYADEDIVDLYNYITDKFDKNLKNTITTYNDF